MSKMGDRETFDRERAERERARVAEAKDLAQRLGNFVNRYDDTGLNEFIEALSHEHRTLQQSLTGLFLRWFKHLSELSENYYDLRNEHAVKVAKMIRERLEQEYGSAWRHMPLI